MSYPQSNSNLAVTSNSSIYRLSTPLASPGDIYESEVGATALSIGPDSDIQNVLVNYYDEQVSSAAGFVNGFALSPQQPWVSPIAARMDVRYPQVNRLGRILFSSLDAYDPSYRPTGFNADDDTLDFIPPQLDVIQYLTVPPSSISQRRRDKTYNYRFFGAIAPHVNWIIIPMYGRKSATFNYANWNDTDTVTLGALGVNYTVTPNASEHLEVPFFDTGTVGPDNPGAMLPFKFSTSGTHDAMVVRISGSTGPFPLRIVVSDDII
jgi:hypothetical protein